MPTYIYKRDDGTKFEAWQSIKDRPLKKCPTTGQKCKRVIGRTARPIFRGTGFYETDYK
jgi:putative FmdB family regulatory protein